MALCRVLRTCALGGVLLVVTGCGTTEPESSTASVRFVNALMDGPTLNIVVDGEQVVRGLSFGEATDYATAATEGTIEVRHGISNTLLLTSSGELTVDRAHTLAVVGDVAALEMPVFLDANTPPAAGGGAFRVINVAPNAEPFGLRLTEPGIVEFRWMEPFDLLTATPYRECQPGTYLIRTFRVGTDEFMREHSLELLPGRMRTVLLIDGVNNYMGFLDLVDLL